MNQDPQLHDLPEADSRFATKADIEELARINDQAIRREVESLRGEMATKDDIAALESRTDRKFNDMLKLIKEQAEETRRHFNVAVENIQDEMSGANKDEISYIRDQKLPEHEERLTALEKHARLA